MKAELAWMLDTNILSDLIRNPRGVLVQRLRSTERDAICTSIVVACEMRFGARRKGSDVLTNRVEQLLASLTILPLTSTTQTYIRCWSKQVHPSAATNCSSPRTHAPAI